MRNNENEKNDHRDFNRYLDYMHKQIREICTNYGKLDLLWFDFSYDDMRGEKWRATELIDMVRTLQPGVIIDNRLEVSGEGYGSLASGNPTPYHGDFVTPEQMIPPEGIQDVNGRDLLWEACVTMNGNWGYHATDRFWKPAPMLIKKLVECVSKGGNLILNVGPNAKGEIPKESLERLAAIGAWMKENGASIYGCGKAGIPKPDMGRITRNGNKLYYHLFENTIGPMPLSGYPQRRSGSYPLSGKRCGSAYFHQLGAQRLSGHCLCKPGSGPGTARRSGHRPGGNVKGVEMFTEERREAVIRKLNLEGKVRVRELSEEFQVTEDCIRKDLKALENAGRLKRTYGGAILSQDYPLAAGCGRPPESKCREKSSDCGKGSGADPGK